MQNSKQTPLEDKYQLSDDFQPPRTQVTYAVSPHTPITSAQSLSRRMESSITDTTDSSIDMTSSFSCKSENPGCSDFHSEDLGKVIEHLQPTHSDILCVPDSKRYRWCCGACTGNGGRKRKRYRSHQAMWDHIRVFHEDWLVDIVETSDWVMV